MTFRFRESWWSRFFSLSQLNGCLDKSKGRRGTSPHRWIHPQRSPQCRWQQRSFCFAPWALVRAQHNSKAVAGPLSAAARTPVGGKMASDLKAIAVPSRYCAQQDRSSLPYQRVFYPLVVICVAWPNMFSTTGPLWDILCCSLLAKSSEFIHHRRQTESWETYSLCLIGQPSTWTCKWNGAARDDRTCMGFPFPELNDWLLLVVIGLNWLRNVVPGTLKS